MKKHNLNRRGFLLLDTIITISLLISLFVVLGYGMSASRMYNKFNLARQRCLAACEGQMDSIAARGKPIDEKTMKRLWEDIDVKIERTAGIGQWDGLELVKVHAVKQSGSQTVKMSIERYIAYTAEKKEVEKASGEETDEDQEKETVTNEDNHA